VQLKAIISIGLAITFPIVSLMGIQWGGFNLSLLSFPDILICLALVQGLRGDGQYVIFLAGFSLILALALTNARYGALFPGLIFFLISRYFLRTLAPNKTPLITLMAHRIRGPDMGFSEDAMRYTRNLTGVWALLFVLLGITQLMLVLEAEERWAWLMGNTFAPALILLFLIAEPLYRRYQLPNEPRHAFRHFITRLLEIDWKGMQ